MSVNISFIKNLSCRHLEDTGQILITNTWEFQDLRAKMGRSHSLSDLPESGPLRKFK